MKRKVLSFIFIASLHFAQGQSTLPCSDILSQAEEAYRKGKFDQVENIAPCMGLYKSYIDSTKYHRAVERYHNQHKNYYKSDSYGISLRGDSSVYFKLSPKRMKLLINELNQYDSTHREYLGNLVGFSNELKENALMKSPLKMKREELKLSNHSPSQRRAVLKDLKRKDSLTQTTPFSKEERQRAYVLLGKTYQVLGVKPLSQFLSRRLIKEHPTYSLLDNENQSFKRIHEAELTRTRNFSAGVIVGWLYTIPVNKEVNREIKPHYKFQTVGSVLLGAHVNYYLEENLSIGLNLWINNTEIEYRETSGFASDDQPIFLHQENQSWIKFPVLVKWIPSKNTRTNDILETRFFVEGGISFNHMVRAKATIAESESALLLTGFNVHDGRNTFNSEVILGIGARFRFGRNYFTFSLNGAYGLRKALKQDKLASENNNLYRQYQVLENNYQTFTGFWSLTYEVRFNTLRKAL